MPSLLLPTHGIIDPACPLNWDHPLVAGLVGEWAVVPNSGWRGGLTLCDLVRGALTPHDCTLTNTQVWDDALIFNGTSNYGTIADDDVFEFSGDFTVAVTLRFNSVSAASAPIVARWNDVGASGRIWSLARDSSGSGALRFDTSPDGATFYAGNKAVTGSNVVSVGPVFHVVARYDSTNNTIYANGVAQATTDRSNDGLLTSITQSIEIGAAQFGGIARVYSAIQVFSVSLFNYAVPPALIQQLSQEQLAGNPERWNWLSARAYFLPLDTAASGLLLRRRREAALAA